MNPKLNHPGPLKTDETHAAQILRAALALNKAGHRTFTRKDIREYLQLSPKEWQNGYTAIFQGMREDHPGGAAPQVGQDYRDVFYRVDRGLYRLTERIK
jgi:hypothetical protein